MLRNPGFGVVGWGMLTFHIICMRGGCYAILGLGRGGACYNVSCKLHALWMLRNPGFGVGWGMLTFHVICMRCGCYAILGLGGGRAC